MKLEFSPIRMDAELSLTCHGDALEINGERFDFTKLEEGFLLPADAVDSIWFAGPVVRQDGQIVVRLLLPHGPDACDKRLFPEPIIVAQDGPVDLSIFEERNA